MQFKFILFPFFLCAGCSKSGTTDANVTPHTSSTVTTPSIEPKVKPDWPFDQPRNAATFTTTHVLKGKQAITHVYHDEDDHGWQFHYSGPKSASDAMVVALQEIVAYDSTVLEVADLPPGWVAVRQGIGQPWTRKRNAK